MTLDQIVEHETTTSPKNDTHSYARLNKPRLAISSSKPFQFNYEGLFITNWMTFHFPL